MNYPKVRIKNSWLLIDALDDWMRPEFKKQDTEFRLSKEFIDKKVEEYSNAWKPYEDKIIHGMCDILGLEFRQNYIDISVAPFGHSFSEPMVISTIYDADRSVEVITHEILHRLLTDNTKLPQDKLLLLPRWKKLFGEHHSFNTLVHIPVHAAMKKIFLDVLNEPERLEHDIERCKKWEMYRLSWEHVQANDYNKIIEDMKNDYNDIEKDNNE